MAVEYLRRDEVLNFEMEVDADPDEIPLIMKGMSIYAEYLRSLHPAEVKHTIILPPGAQPEQKRGHWIVTDIPNLTSTAQDVVTFTRQCRCSECGVMFGRKSDNYCYNCGAEMDGDCDGE